MVLIGRVTKDAVITTLKDDRKVTNFTIAVNDYYKPKGQEKGVTTTTYFDCAYWSSTALAERLTKGSLVEITGRLSVNAYVSAGMRKQLSIVTLILSGFISNIRANQRLLYNRKD